MPWAVSWRDLSGLIQTKVFDTEAEASRFVTALRKGGFKTDCWEM